MTAVSYSRHAGRTSTGPPPAAESIPGDGISQGRHLRAVHDRACCCTGRPAIIAVLPAVACRPRVTELLSCMHHRRAPRHGLAKAHTTVVDANERSLAALGDLELVAARL